MKWILYGTVKRPNGVLTICVSDCGKYRRESFDDGKTDYPYAYFVRVSEVPKPDAPVFTGEE